jgi:RNA polymerase sigma factor (sigma-70 family)
VPPDTTATKKIVGSVAPLGVDPLRGDQRNPTSQSHTERYVRQALKHEGKLRKWLRRLMDNAADVEDVLHDTHVKLLVLGAAEHHEIENVRSYAYQMAKNLVYERTRRNRVLRIEELDGLEESDIAGACESVEDLVDAQQNLERLCDAICKLPTRCRRVFTLHKCYGCTHEEIQEILGISIHSVRRDIRRAYQVLRTLEPTIFSETTPMLSRLRSTR